MAMFDWSVRKDGKQIDAGCTQAQSAEDVEKSLRERYGSALINVMRSTKLEGALIRIPGTDIYRRVD